MKAPVRFKPNLCHAYFLNFGNTGVSESSFFNQFVSKYKTSVNIDSAIWSYELHSQSFDIISSKYSFLSYVNSMQAFTLRIKPCFSDMFYNAVNNFLSLLTEGICRAESVLSMVLPFKTEPDIYYNSKISVLPCMKADKVIGIIIKLVPISLYKSTNLNLYISDNWFYNPDATALLKSRQQQPRVPFTATQKKIINYIQQGMSTQDIAEKEGRVIHSVYKLNRTILQKLSDFFEIEFANAREAVEFYFDCYN